MDLGIARGLDGEDITRTSVDPRHRRLRLAGAGPRRARGPSLGHLLPGLRALRDAHGPATVRSRQPRGSRLSARARRPDPALRARAVRAAGARGGRPARDGEGSRGQVPERRGDDGRPGGSSGTRAAGRRDRPAPGGRSGGPGCGRRHLRGANRGVATESRSATAPSPLGPAADRGRRTRAPRRSRVRALRRRGSPRRCNSVAEPVLESVTVSFPIRVTVTVPVTLCVPDTAAR